MEQLNTTLMGLGIAILTFALNYLRGVVEDLMAKHRIEGALGRAAGLVLEDSAVKAAGNAALGAALDVGVNYLQGAVPDALKRLGVTDERAIDMVRGEVGKLRAMSPAGNPKALEGLFRG